MTTLPEATALLLIELQRASDDPHCGQGGDHEAEGQVARLLAAWRASRRLVVHVLHLASEPVPPLRPGQPGCDLKPEFVPRAGEVVVQKSEADAFFETGLAALLRDRGIAGVVIAGADINDAIGATARVAGTLGFATIVLSDGSWLGGKVDSAGRIRCAQERHAIPLTNPTGENATLVPVGEVLARLAPNAPLASTVPKLVAARPAT